MIWQSTLLMTLIDLVIVVVTTASLAVLYRHRRRLVRAGVVRGAAAMVGGLSLVGAFYVVDLITMWVLPRVLSPATAMSAMENLHFNYSWVVILIATVSIFVGFLLITKKLLDLVHQVERSKDTLEHEISAHHQTHEQREEEVGKLSAQLQAQVKALQRSEEQFRSVIEATRDIILQVDTAGTLCYQSPSIETVLGYAQGERLGGNVLDLVHPDARQDAARAIQEAFAEPGVTHSLVAQFRHKDGTWRWLEAVGTANRSAAGELRAVISARDITDRRHLEEQLRQVQKMEAIGQLAGGVAHDFNNLLTVIGGYAEILEASQDPSVRQGAEQIRRAHDRGAALTRQLLAFARKQVMQPVVLDPNRVVSDLQVFLRRLIGEHIEVTVDLEEGIGNIVADAGQLEQVVVNLVVNARDSMPGGGTLTIRTTCRTFDEPTELGRATVAPGTYVVLQVSDTGHGIDPEMQDRIFDPFFTTKARGKGTGLGLSTVYGIVDQSGGYTVVESEPHVGTTMTVFLPSTGQETASEIDAETKVDYRGSETILVAEDDDEIRLLVATMLERLGYSVLVAQSGTEALSLAAESSERIDLLLADVIMPGMNGPELASRFAQPRPDALVLYMSGYSDDTLEHLSGFNASKHLVVKPFTPTGLSAKIREVLDAAPV